MNWLGIGALALGFVACYVGLRWASSASSRPSSTLRVAALVVLATPAVVYACYYSKLMGEPLWLYRLRAVPGSEFLAAFAGIPAGWAQVRLAPRLRLSRLGRSFLIPVVLGFTLALPYLKPLVRPLNQAALHDAWKDNTCLQSTLSTCGPAAAATIVRRLGGSLSEQQLARESFTSGTGTENWYLARTLERHGFATRMLLSDPLQAPLPAIAGVRLKSYVNSGHFIALLDRRDDQLVIADPMEGLMTNTLAKLQAAYDFTGFFLVIRPAPFHSSSHGR
jgi:hypothetical protein